MGYFPVAFAGILLTGSRSGLLVALVALVGSAVLMTLRNPGAFVGGVFALPAMLAAVWVSAPRQTLERFGTIGEQLQNGDLNQRVNIWRAGWQAFLHAPFCGHGAGSFVAAAGLGPLDTAHNTLLAIAVEGGLFAAVPATAIVLVSVRSTVATRGAIRIGLWTLMAAWILSSMVGTVGENRATWLMLAIFAVSERLVGDQPERMESAFSLHRASSGLKTAFAER